MEELKKMVADNLSAEDQALWEKVFTALEGEDAFGFTEFVGQDAEKLKFLTNNLRQKMAALSNLDRAAIEQILVEEQKFISHE
ncbi:MAG TPA: hypothetical protein VJZ52_01455 [Candidatus Paceibacterota bacterium]|nr:hypothetical protein [Candidatus Paceibacterota bacterium]